jgi:hypothetical protein
VDSLAATRLLLGGVDSPSVGGGFASKGSGLMAYDKLRFERFAMNVKTMADDPEIAAGWLQIDDIANTLGMSPTETIEYANYLGANGWAQVEIGSTKRLRLTPRGHDEIAKLGMPKWKRAIDKNPIIVSWALAAVSIIVAIIISIVSIIINVLK